MDVPWYPVNDFGPAMKGLVIGGLGIFHVFLAQFAIGGGMLMCYFQWLAQTGRSEHARTFIDRYFKVLVLISFVVGAVTGVGMWFTTIQVSARTIGVMVGQFHWLWAVEWTFFCLEVASGYCFYRYASKLDDRTRMTLLVLYSVAAWFSLFWINGILSWQLTPGGWSAEDPRMWAGFFNPSFFPSLIFRTIVAMTIATLISCVVINTISAYDRDAKIELINRAAHFLAPMLLMPFLGIWYFAVIPESSREWAMGGSFVMTLFLGMAISASALIGGYAIYGLRTSRFYINGATATLLCLLAFAATAGGETVREGVRKPYTIREYLYSTSITQPELEYLREVGCVTNDPWPLENPELYPNDQVRLGAKVYRFHCSVCHTLDGANALSHLTGSWTPEQKRLNIAKLQRTKTFMPPFAGTPRELEALVRFITWNNDGRPADWPETHDPAVLKQIQKWLDEVGTTPGIDRPHGKSGG